MNINLLDGFNRQINLELYSAYLYFSISTYFHEINMDGFAKTIKKQALEELEHSKKIYNFLIARDEKIEFLNIIAPEKGWVNPIDAIKSAYFHEKEVTKAIENLYEISKENKDYSSEVFLQWFITEQVEEEEKFRRLLARMENAQNYDCEIVNMNREFEKEG